MVSSRASRMRVFAFGLVVGAAACGLELTGAVGSSTTASGDGGSVDGQPVLDGANGSSGSSGSDIEAGSSAGQPGGPITHLKTWTGSSTGSATITVADVTAASGAYVAAISTKGPINVASVSGLGATWTRVRAQCSSRNQTIVEMWVATSTLTNGAVVATLESAPLNGVMSVSRYANATKIGVAASSNSYGLSGACNNGEDSTSLSLPIAKTPAGRLVGAAAIRLRDHEPGANNVELVELHEGSSGDVAGLAILETNGNLLQGTLSGSNGTDWALAGAELLP